MNPGRELDALVAEKVMDWRDVIDGCGIPPTKNHHCFIPNYSTSMANAWEVVEKLCVGNSFRLDNHYNGDWHVIFHNKYFSQEKTVPHAVCIAALKAVEAK